MKSTRRQHNGSKGRAVILTTMASVHDQVKALKRNGDSTTPMVLLHFLQTVALST